MVYCSSTARTKGLPSPVLCIFACCSIGSGSSEERTSTEDQEIPIRTATILTTPTKHCLLCHPCVLTVGCDACLSARITVSFLLLYLFHLIQKGTGNQGKTQCIASHVRAGYFNSEHVL